MNNRPEDGSNCVSCMWVVWIQTDAGYNRKNSEKSATTWIIYPSFLQGTIVLGNGLEEEL